MNKEYDELALTPPPIPRIRPTFEKVSALCIGCEQTKKVHSQTIQEDGTTYCEDCQTKDKSIEYCLVKLETPEEWSFVGKTLKNEGKIVKLGENDN